MAHKKAGGSVKNGRDSVGQRLGIKAGDGQAVQPGTIIVRQRGMTFLAGPGTDLGGDYTLFATTAGTVKFEYAKKSKKRVRVVPAETIEVEYSLEYGTATLEVHRDAIAEGQRVLIVDDLLATGGTVMGTIELVRRLGGEIAGLAFMVELTGLHGRDKLGDYDIHTLLTY